MITFVENMFKFKLWSFLFMFIAVLEIMWHVKYGSVLKINVLLEYQERYFQCIDYWQALILTPVKLQL